MATASLSQPSQAGLANLLVAIDATHNTVVDVIMTLEDAGYEQAAIHLRRTYSIWPASHLCAMDDTGECVCGASR
jgi:hypothetical protein